MAGPPAPRRPIPKLNGLAWLFFVTVGVAPVAPVARGTPPPAERESPATPIPPVGEEALASGGPLEVRVVAYNLRNWLRMERRVGGEILADASKPEAEKQVAARWIAQLQPDVLGVCEIGTEEDVLDLQARLRGAGVVMPYWWLHRGADPVRRLAVLSRFPLSVERPAAVPTYDHNQQTFAFQRGALDTTVEITPAYRLRLLTTHLKSRREVAEGDQAVMRRQEAVLLRAQVDRILQADPETNLLVMGDFNDTKNEQPIKVIQGRFGDRTHLRDVWLADANGHRFTYYWEVADTYDRIDFAFVNDALWPEIETRKSFVADAPDWLQASDHRPLVVVVRAADTKRR